MGFGIYIHFPFCRSRCPYCDFATTDDADLHRRFRTGYVEVLRREWALRRRAHPGIAASSLTSVYFGGGTPNLMSAEEIAPLLTDVLSGVGGMDVGLEITVEMNPGVTDASELHHLRETGINRASLGVQSTDDRLLRALGREHSASDARSAYEEIRETEFDSVGVDLIFGIPGQTLADWDATLREVIAWRPDHVSTYNLTAKDQTRLGDRVRSGEITLPGDDETIAMFAAAHGSLSEAGYEHFEISNFARPGHRCRHTSDVWRGEPYLGLGLGAHSCLGDERFWNTSDWEEYHRLIGDGELASSPDLERDTAARLAESLYLGLRTREGVSLDALAHLRKTKRLKIEGLVEEGLAEVDGDRLRLTLRGWAVADAVVSELI
ncbi:radical SAM family heme chaperone HemW [Candidatus Sumerlaeota bacterium]|nr:radical SAM family heme chaperone HemW [Candidatus Sumerlaeota bacterium]